MMAKHEKCIECGLKIRCDNKERHDKGISHIQRKARLEAEALERAKKGKSFQPNQKSEVS